MRVPAPNFPKPENYVLQNPGAQGRIRTFVPRKEEQIYSLPALTTHPPVQKPRAAGSFVIGFPDSRAAGSCLPIRASRSRETLLATSLAGAGHARREEPNARGNAIAPY